MIMKRTLHRGRRLVGAACLSLLCCGEVTETPSATEPETSLSLDAKLETVQMLREDNEAVRHPSDGGGRASAT